VTARLSCSVIDKLSSPTTMEDPLFSGVDDTDTGPCNGTDGISS
jgi:hypothetical protein